MNLQQHEDRLKALEAEVFGKKNAPPATPAKTAPAPAPAPEGEKKDAE